MSRGKTFQFDAGDVESALAISRPRTDSSLREFKVKLAFDPFFKEETKLVFQRPTACALWGLVVEGWWEDRSMVGLSSAVIDAARQIDSGILPRRALTSSGLARPDWPLPVSVADALVRGFTVVYTYRSRLSQAAVNYHASWRPVSKLAEQLRTQDVKDFEEV